MGYLIGRAVSRATSRRLLSKLFDWAADRGMVPWRPHDLRRTAASKMSALGVARQVLQAILNHKDRSVTAIYDRYGLDPERQAALIDWGRRVETITGGEPEGRVVEFRARGAV